MSVFNIAANQIQAEPVTNYYKGNAIRQQQDQSELANESIRLENAAHAARELRAERQLGLEEERERRFKEQWEQVKNTQAGENYRKMVETGLSAYEQSLASGQSEESARKFAFETFVDAADRIIPGNRDAAMRELESQGLTPEKFDIVKLRAAIGERPSGYAPTQRMVEGLSMGLEPGSEAWATWLTDDKEKSLAIERKMDIAKSVLNRTGEYEGISDQEQSVYLQSLGLQLAPKGSITMDMKTAEDLANNIMDKTGIGENWLGNNNDDLASTLAFSLMRLARDGRFGGKELEQRALLDAMGYSWDEAVEAVQAKQASGEDWTMDDVIRALADE